VLRTLTLEMLTCAHCYLRASINLHGVMVGIGTLMFNCMSTATLTFLSGSDRDLERPSSGVDRKPKRTDRTSRGGRQGGDPLHALPRRV
jgi:hypothetical protein